MVTSSKILSKTSNKTRAPVSAATKLTPIANLKTAAKSMDKPKIPAKPAVKSNVKKISATVPATKSLAKLALQTLIEKPIKTKKIKLVRDSFTIPKPEYLILDNLKLRAADLKHPIKKSELLRAGIKALAAMPDTQLLLTLKAVPTLKTGRPSK